MFLKCRYFSAILCLCYITEVKLEWKYSLSELRYYLHKSIAQISSSIYYGQGAYYATLYLYSFELFFWNHFLRPLFFENCVT